jgi:predicted transcriptional regulator
MGKEKLNEEEIKEIQEGLENIKRGEVTSIEQVARELGITLK